MEAQQPGIVSFGVSSRMQRLRLFSIILTLSGLGVAELLLTALRRAPVPTLAEVGQWAGPLGWSGFVVVFGGLGIGFGRQVVRVFPYPKEARVVAQGLRVIFGYGEDDIPWAEIARVRITRWRQGVLDMDIKRKGARELHFRDFDRIQELASLVQEKIPDATNVVVRRRMFHSASVLGTVVIRLLAVPVAWILVRVILGFVLSSNVAPLGAAGSLFGLFLTMALVILLLADGVASLRGHHFLGSIRRLEEIGGLRIGTIPVIGLLEVVLAAAALICCLVVVLISLVLH